MELHHRYAAGRAFPATDGRFKVITNDMSTQVFGQYEDVMDALTRELKPTFEHDGKAIFVMKVLGPLG